MTKMNKPTDIERFWSYVQKTENCWNWTGSTQKKGYGTSWFRNRLWRAHRVSWTITNGDIPEGLMVLHACDNTSCVNPQHLFLGTAQDNTNDMLNKGRWRKPRLIFGEDRDLSKLTDSLVVELRRERIERGSHYTDMARRLGLSPTTVRHAVLGLTWPHVAHAGEVSSVRYAKPRNPTGITRNDESK